MPKVIIFFFTGTISPLNWILSVVTFLERGRVVIANVNNGGHFVLLTGYSKSDNDTFAVNDPGYNRDYYSYSNDVVGYRIFDMARL